MNDNLFDEDKGTSDPHLSIAEASTPAIAVDVQSMEAGVEGLLWKYKLSVTGSTWEMNWVFCNGKKFLQWGENIMRPDKSQAPKYSLDLMECTVKESGQRPYAFEIIDNFTKQSAIFATNSDQSFQVWWYALSHPKSEPVTPTSSFKPHQETGKGISSPVSNKCDDDRENGEDDEEVKENESEVDYEEEDEYSSDNRNATIIRTYFEQQVLDSNLVPNRVLQFIAQQLQYPSLDDQVTCKEFLSIWLLFEEVFIPNTKAQCFEYYLYPTPGTPNPNLFTFQGRSNTHQISYICPMMFRIHIPTRIMSSKSPLMTHIDHDKDADDESSMHGYMEDLIRATGTKILEQLTQPTAAASPNNPSSKPYDWYGVYTTYLMEVQHLTKKYQQTNNINNEISAQTEAEKQHFFDEVIFKQSVSIMTLWHSFHIMAMQGCELFVKEYTLPIHLKSMVPIKLPSVVKKSDKNSAIDDFIGEKRNPHATAESILGTQAGVGTPLPHNTTTNEPQVLSMNRVEIIPYLYLQEQVYEYHGIYLYSFALHLLDPANAADMSAGTAKDLSAASVVSNEPMHQRMYCKAYELYQKIYLTEWKNYLVLQREYDRVWMEEYLATRYCPHLYVAKAQASTKQEVNEVAEVLEDVKEDKEVEVEHKGDVEEEEEEGSDNHRLHHRDHVADDDSRQPNISASHQTIMLDEMLVRRRFITMVDYHGYRMIAYVPTPGSPIPVTFSSSQQQQQHPIQEIMQSIILKLQSRLYAIHPMTMSSYSLLGSSSCNTTNNDNCNNQQDSMKKQGYYVNHTTVLSPDLFSNHTPVLLIKQLRKELLLTFTHKTSNDPNADDAMREGSDSDEDEGDEEERSDDEEENEGKEKKALFRRSAGNNHKKKLITKQHFLINEEAQTSVHHAQYTGNKQTVKQDDHVEDAVKVLAGTAVDKTVVAPTSITPWISLCRHLYSNVLPTFVHHLDQYYYTHASSGSLLTTASSSPYGLTNLLHRYGLNIRHLGILYSLTKNPFHKQVFLTEMLCRSVKLIYQTLMTTYVQEMSNESLLKSSHSKSSLLHFQEFHHVMNEYKQEIVLGMLNIFYPCSQDDSSSSSTFPSSAANSSQSAEQVKTKKQFALLQSEFMDMLLDILYNKFGVVFPTISSSVRNPADLQEGESEEERNNNEFEYLMALELKQFDRTKAKEEQEEKAMMEKDDNKRKVHSRAIRITPNITISAPSDAKPDAMNWLDQYDLHPIQFFHSLQYHLGCQLKEIVNATKLHPKLFQNQSNTPFLASDMIHFFLPKVHIQQLDEEEMGYLDIPYDLASRSTSLALSSNLTEWMVLSGLSKHPLQTTNTFNSVHGHHLLHGSKGLVGRWSGLGEADHHIGLVGYGGNVDYFFALSYLPCFCSQKMLTEGFSLLQCYYYLKVPLYHHLLTLIAPTSSSAEAVASSTVPSLDETINTDTNSLSSTPYLPKLAWSQQYALSNITYHYLTLCGQLKQMREYQHILKTYLQHPYTLYSCLPTHDILSLSFHHFSLSNTPSDSSAKMSTYNLLDQLYYSSAYSLLPTRHVGQTVTILTLISTLEAQQHPEAYTQAHILLLWLQSCWNYCHSPDQQLQSSPAHQAVGAGGENRYCGIDAMIGYLCYRLGQISVKLKEDPKQSIAWFEQAHRMYYQFFSPESINSQGNVSSSCLRAEIIGTGNAENISQGGVFMSRRVRADDCFVLSVPLSQQSTPQLYQALHLLYCLNAQYSLTGSPITATSSSNHSNNMLHTLSQIPTYLNHYAQLNVQLTAFQQHYAQTIYTLTTRLKHHHHRRGEEVTAGMLRVQFQVSDEIVGLILSTYELLSTGYNQNSEYHFTLNYLQQLLLFVHCLLLSLPLQSPVATTKHTIFLDPLTQQQIKPNNISSDAYLTSLYMRLNIQFINNLMLTYSDTTRHLLTSIATDYNARSYHDAMTECQQQLLVRNEYLEYDECILIMVDFLIAVLWNHGTVEYVEGLVRKVLQVEEYLDHYEQNEEEGGDGGDYDGYEDDSEVEEDEKEEGKRENSKKPKKYSINLTRCYLSDDELVKDYLMTKPATIQSMASSTAHITRLQRILGRRRRLSTTPSTVLQTSYLTRQEIHKLRRQLPLYGQVFVLNLLLTEPTLFAHDVTRLYSLPPVQYIPVCAKDIS